MDFCYCIYFNKIQIQIHVRWIYKSHNCSLHVGKSELCEELVTLMLFNIECMFLIISCDTVFQVVSKILETKSPIANVFDVSA